MSADQPWDPAGPAHDEGADRVASAPAPARQSADGPGRRRAQHGRRRAPRKRVLGGGFGRREFLLAAATLGVVVFGTLLFGALTEGSVTPVDEGPSTSTSSVPTSSVVTSPTAQASTAEAEPDRKDGRGKKGKGKKGKQKAEQPKGQAASTGGPQPDQTEPTKAASKQVAKVPVLVLNNSRVNGLAARHARTISAEGWSVVRTDNWKRTNVDATTIFYAPGNRPAARAFAEDFGFVVAISEALPGMTSDLTLVLTSDAA